MVNVMAREKKKYSRDPNPPLSKESKCGVLKYYSNFSKFDLSWEEFLKRENRYDLYGWRGKNASNQERKLAYQVQW